MHIVLVLAVNAFILKLRIFHQLGDSHYRP